MAHSSFGHHRLDHKLGKAYQLKNNFGNQSDSFGLVLCIYVCLVSTSPYTQSCLIRPATCPYGCEGGFSPFFPDEETEVREGKWATGKGIFGKRFAP